MDTRYLGRHEPVQFGWETDEHKPDAAFPVPPRNTYSEPACLTTPDLLSSMPQTHWGGSHSSQQSSLLGPHDFFTALKTTPDDVQGEKPLSHVDQTSRDRTSVASQQVWVEQLFSRVLTFHLTMH